MIDHSSWEDITPLEDANYDIVGVQLACPVCGENRIDYLAIDETTVTCLTCGAVYEIE